jgi:hypothetical protein
MPDVAWMNDVIFWLMLYVGKQNGCNGLAGEDSANETDSLATKRARWRRLGERNGLAGDDSTNERIAGGNSRRRANEL